MIGTEIVWVSTPGSNVSEPLLGVKSFPPMAVPLLVLQSTVTVSVGFGGDSRTVSVAVPADSDTATSSIASVGVSGRAQGSEFLSSSLPAKKTVSSTSAIRSEVMPLRTPGAGSPACTIEAPSQNQSSRPVSPVRAVKKKPLAITARQLERPQEEAFSEGSDG